MKKLQNILKEIDGRGYKGYKAIQGAYAFSKYQLIIDYVQGDPFASPSKIRIIIPNAKLVKDEWMKNKKRKVYLEDYIARQYGKVIHKSGMKVKGTGKSGLLLFDNPGQEILERTAVTVSNREIVICMSVGLPANGRRINGKEAEKLFFTVIPTLLNHSVFSMKDEEIEKVVQLADQHEVIRKKMQENGWISFIGEGSILPRENGISNRPLKKAVPFQSPMENRVSITIPHLEEPLIGMAIREGINIIVGGGYHGKSTLLTAIERGVYHHTIGDGREYVLTDSKSVKVRAEDGRKVTSVNISPFINHLPLGGTTERFSTDNGSGSTSQAANVMEALEAGAQTLLIDEDTSATNFMIRDNRMQMLVAKEKEPITPYIDKVKQLKDDLSISSILVMGGSGDYFDVADDVIMMNEYVPVNVTDRAKDIAKEVPFERKLEGGESFGEIPKRVFHTSSINSRKGNKYKTQGKGLTTIVMGAHEIQLQGVEQLVDPSQTRMIAELIRYIEKQELLKKGYSLTELLDVLEKQLDAQGLASITNRPNEHPGELARPRRFEIAAALNRIRIAKIL